MKPSHAIALVMFLVSCSSSGPKSGPELCVEAGGQCISGSAQCAKRGDADCNPERNPGGAFCCLSCGGAGPEPSDTRPPTCQ